MLRKKILTACLAAVMATAYMPAMAFAADGAASCADAKALYEAAQEEYNQAKAQADADAKAQANAKAALDEAKAASAQAQQELTDAQAALKEIDATLEGSDEKVAQAQAAQSTAKEAADAAAANKAAKDEAYKQAAATAETTAKDAADKAAALEQCTTALADADAALTQANSDLEAAQADKDAKDAAQKDAKDKRDAAQAEYDVAVTATQQAEAAATAAAQKTANAKSAYDTAKAKYEQGALGFFESVNSPAAQVLKDAANGTSSSLFKGKVLLTDPKDATSLNNMAKTFTHMKYLNNLRKSLGLSELKVTDTLMAYAQADADYSDTVIGHASVFNIWENVAWNYGSNPYTQWYDEEKAYFDQAVKDVAGSDLGLTGKAAYDYYNAHMTAIENWLNTPPRQESVGHYINDINPSLNYTGFAVTTRGTMNGWHTMAQTFHSSSSETSYTVDAYETRFGNYKSGLDADIEAYEVALEEQEAAEAAYAKAKASQAQASSALAEATNAKNAADQAAADAAANLNAKQAAKDTAVQNQAAAKSAKDAAQTASDTAAETATNAAAAATEAKTALDTATTEEQTAAEAYQKASDDLTALQNSITEAQANRDAAVSRVASAENKVSTAAEAQTAAQSAYETAQTTASQSAQVLTEKEAVMNEAKKTYDDAVIQEQKEKAEEEARQIAANTPAKSKIIKLKPAKKAMTVTWKKVKGATGYRIQYALDKKFKKSLKTKTVKKYSKKGLKIKKLKSKKTYYVRIQTFRTVNGKTYKSKWSTAKKVKIK